MHEKIQLKHPAGKHAVKIDKNKYDVINKSILRCLKNKALTHKELFEAISEDFENNKFKFDGSVEWYMESVKLDMEARAILHRVKVQSKLKFELSS